MIYALDTCTITFLLRGDFPARNKFTEKMENNHQICIPPIAYYETIRGLMAINAQQKLNDFEFFTILVTFPMYLNVNICGVVLNYMWLVKNLEILWVKMIYLSALGA
jgi:DNA integrity scanning protein DisA with diadenylate cyclase activity